ncbi:MAG: hypothetical protein M1825_004712 [Sarcosagium campestre]|nr:MAG: hypothetical protein M1825_004712 [Sarcosagium campestre]
MDDDTIAQFTTITNSSPAIATQYLQLSDGNLEQAMQLFFESGGIDMESQDAQASIQRPDTSSQRADPHPTHRQRRLAADGPNSDDDVIQIDSDDDDVINREGIYRRNQAQARPGGSSSPRLAAVPTSPQVTNLDDDEAMARRMQEEFYAGGDMAALPGETAVEGGIRAPIARTTETLVGPGADWTAEDEGGMHAALEAQMAARRHRMNRAGARPGIFNQRPTSSSVWDEPNIDANTRRQVLSQATAGASEASTKASMLAEMYRPPIEIISRLSWDEARAEGKSMEKWILVNVQDPSVFDCQVLNRDIWKDAQIMDTVKENFIFMQYDKNDPRGAQYMQFYFSNKDAQDAYPHIAIVDPRTGEQVKVWAGPPAPKPMDFLMQLHEFLDRYSLKVNAKNPVARRKPEKKKAVNVDSMTEEEMLEMAMQNSLANANAARRTDVIAIDDDDDEVDPDALTRSPPENLKGKQKATAVDGEIDVDDYIGGATNGHSATATAADAADDSSGAVSPFALISSTKPHVEPAADPATTTRIQFRHSGGRVIRRFALSDPLRRLYEWLKAEPLDNQAAGDTFELVCMGRNLLDRLDDTIEAAGLRNQTVMVEFVQD